MPPTSPTRSGTSRTWRGWGEAEATTLEALVKAHAERAEVELDVGACDNGGPAAAQD
jgi:hypothetical protein